jgi:hypothetical protein
LHAPHIHACLSTADNLAWIFTFYLSAEKEKKGRKTETFAKGNATQDCRKRDFATQKYHHATLLQDFSTCKAYKKQQLQKFVNNGITGD